MMIFIFRGTPMIHALTIDWDSSIDIWHNRLGHPSEKVLKFILMRVNLVEAIILRYVIYAPY